MVVKVNHGLAGLSIDIRPFTTRPHYAFTSATRSRVPEVDYAFCNMDERRKGALRSHHQALRTGLLVETFLPDLRQVLTDAEYSRVDEREDNIARVDELIRILLTKENRHFDAFCAVLERNGFVHWARRLQKEVSEMEG